MQVLCHYLMSFYEFETKEKQWNVEDASLLAVLLTTQFPLLIIVIANNGRSSAKAVSTKHRKFKFMLKSRCLQKSKSVDWGAAPPLCDPSFFVLLLTPRKSNKTI